MVARAVIESCKNGSVNIGLLAGENREGVDFMQQYGFSSRPKGNVSAVALFVGGSRDNGVVVASRGDDSDMGVELEEGEVAVHSPFGSVIHLKKDGSILMKPAEGARVRIDSELEVTNNILSTGDVAAGCVDVDGKIMDMPAVHLKQHLHPTAVGPTSATTGP